MKYFSLFNGEEIHSTPKEKIIPQDEFVKLLDASEILAKIKKEGEEFLIKTHKECEKLKQKAHDKGFEEGFEKFNKSIIIFDEEAKKLRSEFNKAILPIALKAAKKILGEELKLHPERISDIVIQALKPVTQHHHVKIYVNKADLEQLEKDRPKIKKMLEQLDSFSLQERMDVEPGGCIIETEAGIINAQLENQWRALEAALKSFKK